MRTNRLRTIVFGLITSAACSNASLVLFVRGQK